MSAIDDENSNTCDDNTDINAATDNENTGTVSDHNKHLSLDTNKNTGIIGAKSKSKPQSVINVTLTTTNKDSGDVSQDALNENLVKPDKMNSLAKMTEELISVGQKCSGDFVAKSSDESDEIKNVKIHEAVSKPTNIDEKSEGIDSPIENSNNIELKTGDDHLDDVEDDDMKLTWEDDDTSDQVMPENNGKPDSNKKHDIVSEQQLLEDNESNPGDSTEKVNKCEDVLKETEIHPEAKELEAETDIFVKKSVKKDNNDLLEDKLLEESEMNAGSSQIRPDINISEEKGMDINSENLLEKSPDSVSSAIDAKIETTEIDIPLEPKLLQDAEINTESSKIPSDKDIAMEIAAKENEDKSKEKVIIAESKRDALNENDDLMLEEQLLEETEANVVSSDKIPKTNISMTQDLDKIDKILEDTLLDESQVIPEVDISPAKNVDCEDELLIDAKLERESTTMEVDNIDQSDCQATSKEKMVDQPMIDQDELKEKSEMEPVNQAVSVDDPGKLKTKNPDTSINDQSGKIDEKDGDHLDSPNETELVSNSPLEAGQAHLNTPKIDIEQVKESANDKIEIKNKPELEKIHSSDITEDKNEDVNMNESNISSTSTQISPIRIQTHGLHKPDVMLEIPTQELIDIDTDLSMNLDQTGEVDPDNADGKVCEDVDIEETGETRVSEEQGAQIPTPDIVADSSLAVEKAKDSVSEKTIEENLEEMFATDAEPTHKAAIESIVTRSPKPEESNAQPSTSFAMTPDTSDELPEVSDSLGLLAESSGRVMEDDEDPEDDDDGDDDDDFDQDESSNLVSAEQSDDSNPAPSETEPARDQEEKDMETPESQDMQFEFTIDNVECSSREKAEKMEIEVEEYGTLQLQAESINDEETKSAVNALLKDAEGATNENVEGPKATEQMEIETVKLSDTSDNEVDDVAQVEQTEQSSGDKEAKDKSAPTAAKPSPSKESPSKLQKLAIATMQASNVVNIVDLEETSSSEDDIQEVQKLPEDDSQLEVKAASPDPENITKVNIPTGIDVMCTSGGNTSEITTKEGEVVISGIPKPPPQKPARLNTSEVSIKTASNAEPLVIPETKINEQIKAETKSKHKLSLEIFSLDSDEEDGTTKEKPITTSPHKMTALELEKARETSKCINYCCTSSKDVGYRVADAATVAYYDAGRKRRSMVCQPCAEVVANRTKNLMQGIKDLTPLFDLEMSKMSQDLVEISDSESEDEDMTPDEPKESIGEKGARFLEENLAQILNATWSKYDMDCRLKETQIMLDDEIEKLEQDSKEIDAMLNECQIATDKLRCELYATFEHRRHERPALLIHDTPDIKYIGPELDATAPTVETTESRLAKRRLSSSSETVAKRPAIPLGYAPLDADPSSSKDLKLTIPAPDNKLDDDKDVSVVKLSAEAAPADLPPPGELARPPLRVGAPVYAMKNAFGPWLKGKILEIQPKTSTSSHPFTLCRVKFDHKTKTNGKVLPARCIAYAEPADVRMTIGTRLIALFTDTNKRESYYSGVVAEIPNPVNNYRYLVFFDDGYAQYVAHARTRLVCESSALVWEEVHPLSREFVRDYLLAYPERPMVRLHHGQHLKTEWNGKWWPSRVIKVDASLAQVMFVGDGRREWIYRGSTRLAPLYLELRAAERHRPRPMPRSKAQPRFNMPYVEYTRSDEQDSSKQAETQVEQQQQSEEIRRQRAVAKKSTSLPQAAPPPLVPFSNNQDAVTSRVVYYTPKNAVKPYKMTPHKCGPKCKRSDVLSLKELRTYNPLAKPLLSGWERQIVRYKGHKEVMYRAPCGRRVRSVAELHQYLRATASDLPVDLFDFHPATHCLAEFVLNKCLVGKKDLSHGKENVPVPCVNYYDESLPEFCSYNTERTPTAGVPLNLDPEFLCGCDCTDDCQDKSKCACWKMTLEGARTIGLVGSNVGYVYKRLPEPLPSGIYECNSRCKCKHTCLNRVAQHPLQLKLQVFKTPNRGWGIRALNDVPKGSFLCVYAGNLLTDATANLDGLNEGDEYLAELDYIEVVEQMKEGYEEDIPEADKKLDKKDNDDDDDEDDESSSSDDDDTASKTDKEDDDFRPGYIGLGVQEFSKRLRRREKSKKDKEAGKQKEKEKEKEKEKDKDTKDSNAEDDCITISDDEEVREPSRFNVQAGMGAGEFISKYKSVRTLFGMDEACYIMDAKVQGNIGRYLNHSCCPNVFVQNVFVDTHDPRFPWVAFFALSHIKAGTELTWNYNYDVGSVPGKVLYCYCGAVNCRGRLL